MVSNKPLISIIIPCLNEAATIRECLERLKQFRIAGHEIIVVDGGSQDDTVELCRGLADRIIDSKRGRAIQFNTGANVAQGELFVFLHADTVLPPRALSILNELVDKTPSWGRFDVRLSGKNVLFRVIECLMNFRSRLTGVATGDQAIFVSRTLFQRVEGFPNIALMEDISISKKLRKLSKPYCIKSPVITSTRRWESKGIIKTMMLMHVLRLRFALGADPAKLARAYD